MLEKTYRPQDVEARLYSLWEEAGAFACGRPERADAEPFCIVIPPPNVTGSLHMGHALNNTIQDILVRFERMRGKDVLWQPGTDHAGIATQMVVERQLMEKGEPNRRTMGRAAFIERVWAWKEESGGLITNQLRRLGASCDWSRERFTMDEGLSKAVLKVFVELYRKGLIYKDKRLVNWDPKLLTAISDLEVVPVETRGHLWHLRYPLEEKCFDPDNPATFITVATTRPETMLGDVAVAVHPDDERYRRLVGSHVILPLVGRRMPIVADEHADPEQGSGAVKITPAHDVNDFEVGRRHGLSPINVLDPEARITLKDNAAFLKGVPQSEDLVKTIAALDGLDRFAARQRLVAMMEERGLVEKVEDHVMAVPYGDRSNVVIEPYLTDQWYVDAKTLAGPAIEAVEQGRTVFVPKNWEKTYFEWMRNIQPWCISRQLWWGHQIPAWYHISHHELNDLSPSDALHLGEIRKDLHPFVVVESQEEAIAAIQERFSSLQVEVVDGPEQAAKLWLNERAIGIWRDPDVLDTWFSSALWPFSTLGWPEETPELKRFYPTDVLVTAFDIIFFWVARMMMMGLRFMHEVPFRTVYIHALVRDEKGQKMSKSKGNVIDPLRLIDEYGADALRFTLAAMAAQGRDIKLSAGRVEGYRNFATKLWNAARFCEMNECVRVADFDPKACREILNRWVVGEAERAAKAVGEGIETHRYNEAAAAIYRFVWNVFCDWYVELSKSELSGEDSAARAETRAAAAWTLDQILRLLHPFMPFLTEELWQRTGEAGPARESLLILADWPALDGLADAAADAEIGWLIDLIGQIRSVRMEMNVPAGALIPLVLVGGSEEARTRAGLHGETIRRLARLETISFAGAAPQGAVQLVLDGATAALPLSGIIDLKAEQARLEREIAKIDGEIGKIVQKLENENFISRAPEHVIEEQRERHSDAEHARARLSEALKRLQGAA
ncbi:MAG: valine--tRNA ligase [Hyphomicrobiales bacterium]|nr:valine--tRNA ligase [Hyphomicrobiales bacterium]